MRLNRTGWQWGKALSQLGKKTVKNTNMTFRGTALMLVAVCAFTAALRWDAHSARAVSAPAMQTPAPIEAINALGHLPLIFEQNDGQTDAQVKFLARGGRYELFLTPAEAVLELQNPSKTSAPSRPTASVLRMGLAHANANVEVSGANRLPGKSNYFIGNDPAQWHRNISQFARVRYHEVYPGVDLIYYGHEGQLEYDFEVAPGADAGKIALQLQGANHITLEANGDLAMHTRAGEIRLHAPRVYQTVPHSGQSTPVAAKFALRGNNQVGFALADYDRSRALVIDPVLSYSTYLGGSGAESCSTIIGQPVTGTTSGGANAGVPRCPAVAVDSAQNIYIAGSTMSTDFPGPSGTAPRLGTAGTANVFIAKINPSASPAAAQLIFSTYLGGNGVDYTAGVGVDSGFNVAVAGTTSSSNFPASLGYQTAPLSSGNHVFASKLDPSGSILLYSTYLSGSGADVASGLALDTSGLMYVTGTTTSQNFPTIAGDFQTRPLAATQFFFSKLNPFLTGVTSLSYSTYIGGSTASGATPVTIGGGIAVDSSFSVYVSGGTNFSDMPILNAYQQYAGGLDAWVAKFLFPQNSQTPPTLSYLTYFGGTGDDIAYGVAVDQNANAYITGSTTSADIAPATATVAFQPSLDCPIANMCPPNPTAPDAFVARFGVLCTATGCTVTTLPLTYFSYLGGTANDIGLDIAVDTIGGARLTGWTNSSDFHTLNNPANLFYGGGVDAFVARIDTTSNSPTSLSHFSSYLGGSGTDVGTGVAVDSLTNSYVAGETTSVNFPYDNPYQTAINGPSDAFATKLGSLANLVVTETATPNPVGVGNNVTFTYTITNDGDAVTGMNFNSNLPASGTTFISASASPGSCNGVTNGSVGCTLGTLNAGAIATVTVVLAPTVAQPLGNTGTVTIAGSNLQFSPQVPASVTVYDYLLAISPSGPVTVPAGIPAVYTLNVAPTPAGGTIPNSVTLACGSGLPSGATCTFTNNPMPNLNTGPQSSTMVINSVARVSVTTQLERRGPLYAAILPLFGLAFLGVSLRGSASRKKKSWVARVLGIFLVGAFLLLSLFSAGCSSSSTVTTTTGTPAGTYTVIVNATSGTITHSESVTYIVQ